VADAINYVTVLSPVPVTGTGSQ